MTEATFESRCPYCDQKIYEGEEIWKLTDGDWAHKECAMEELEE